jgi:hypothetical protein
MMIVVIDSRRERVPAVKVPEDLSYPVSGFMLGCGSKIGDARNCGRSLPGRCLLQTISGT